MALYSSKTVFSFKITSISSFYVHNTPRSYMSVLSLWLTTEATKGSLSLNGFRLGGSPTVISRHVTVLQVLQQNSPTVFYQKEKKKKLYSSQTSNSSQFVFS